MIYVEKKEGKKNLSLLFFFFRIGFQPINVRRLIQLLHRDMRTGQVLFPLRIELNISQILESNIPQIRLWKKLLATGAQT